MAQCTCKHECRSFSYLTGNGKWPRCYLYDRRGSGSCLKRRLLLVWLIKRVSWFYIWFLIAVSLCTCRRSNEDFFESPRPSLAKEGSTFSPSPSSSGSGDVTALRCSEPLRYKVGGASKPSPWLCGMGPPYYSLLIGTARIVPHCSIALHLSSLEWGILFILLLIGLPQERCPSGL